MFNRSTSEKPTELNRAINETRPAILIAVFFSLFINLLALVSPLYMLQVYDRVLQSRSTTTLVFITLIAVFLYFVYGALESLRTQVLVRAGIKFDGEVRGHIFKSVLDATVQHRPGGSQAFRDVDMVREFLTGSGLISFCDVPWTPVFVIVAFILHPYFGVLAIIAGAVILGLAITNDYFTRAPLQRATVASIAAQSDASATLRNSEVMHAMGMWSGLQSRWQVRRDELIGWQAQASDRGGAVISGIKMFRQIVQTLILGGGAYLAIKGKASPGAMVAASIIVGRALAPIEMAVGQWKGFVGARDAWDRLQTLFRGDANAAERMSLPGPKGRLTVEGATVAPPGRPRPTVIGASFGVEPGTSVAVIGPSAAGKSSLARALVGVWPTAAGAIRLDGFDLKHWDPQQLGPYVGYLPQDVELFSGTVAENIARFGEFKSEDVIEAAQIAGVHELIQSLPDGYETQIGEGGQTLSGGQRQRIALARTIYRRPALIVLDEPNANLDSHGEAALANALMHLKGRSTIVFVTHKINLLSVADKVLVMQNGQVVQFGDRDPILKQLMQPAANVPAPTPANA
ncbi:MAG: type I secretion system permease/ATPase [Alphaproteobacteria bacterium]|nr:type I secretion system permease/ATPase [Alphaproteobacteria bacterium]